MKESDKSKKQNPLLEPIIMTADEFKRVDQKMIEDGKQFNEYLRELVKVHSIAAPETDSTKSS